jgi:probable rRNA maturation factor
MSITFHTEEVKRPKLKYRIVSAWLKQIIIKYNCVPGDLTYVFCDDEYLKGINVKFLDHDYYTDIVTFDYCMDEVISGDMFISIERVKENSVLFESTFNDELLRVMVHGLLHLLRYSDSTDSETETMRQMENECILMYREI